MTQRFPRFTEDFTALEEDRFQNGSQSLPLFATKSCQYAILQGRGSDGASHLSTVFSWKIAARV